MSYGHAFFSSKSKYSHFFENKMEFILALNNNNYIFVRNDRGERALRRLFYYGIMLIGVLILGFKLHSKVNRDKDSTNEKLIQVKQEYNPVCEIEPIIAPFDSLTKKDLKTSGTVGAAVVISYKGQIAYLQCYGVRKAGTKDSVNEHTIFRLASVSKTVTGVLAGILDDENILHLDDKVTDYLPNFRLKDSTNTNHLKIRNLLSQTTGVIPHAFDLMVEDKVSLNDIISHLNEADISAAPGKMYTYQNVMYSVYKPVLEAKTQEKFQKIMQETVFEPFGMHDASLSYQAFKKNKNKAYPHVCVDKNKFKAISLNDRYYSTTPAAGVNASISDLGNFLCALTNPDSEMLSYNAKQTIFTPQIASPLKHVYFRAWGKGVKNKSYALGWRSVNYRGHKVSYHGGYVNGYKAEIALCNDDDIGIAILCNSPNSETVKCIPAFLNMFFKYNDCYVKEKESNAEYDFNPDKS
jgi:beta-lactamase class C